MDEKRRLPLHRAAPADMTTAVVRRRRTRLWIPVLLIVLLGYSLLSSCNVDVRGRLDRLSKEATSAAAKAVGSRRKVPLEVHIMSKCPDAKVRTFYTPSPFFTGRLLTIFMATGRTPRAYSPCHAAGPRQG